MPDEIAHAVVLVLYLLSMLGIGLFFYRRNKNQADYFLGGRNLNVWVTSMSAQASDMSGWLMMGLPGAAFLLTKDNSLAQAVWMSIGLAAGTYFNWLIVAKRLRNYTEFHNSITIPTYFENRFQDKSHLIRKISAVFIVIFFLIYTAAQFSAGAKLFTSVFGMDYRTALIIGAIVIVSYTFLGGFMAVCWTDLIQGSLMFLALLILPVLAIAQMGGSVKTFDLVASVANIPGGFGFREWTGIGSLSLLSIISTLAWGLGYMGQPHILVRFMGIRRSRDVKIARRIAIVWVSITLFASILIGVIGRAYLSTVETAEQIGALDGEKVFIYLVQSLLKGPGAAILAGLLLTTILAAIMSTADSQLLVTSSAISEDLCRPLLKSSNSEKQLIWISRGSVIVIALIALWIAGDPNSSVLNLVSYAWAGFGAAFGPAILLSLYWKRMNWQGALAGILSGGITVILWKTLVRPYFDLYELLPAFIVSVIFIVVVSMVTKEPSEMIQNAVQTSASENDVAG